MAKLIGHATKFMKFFKPNNKIELPEQQIWLIAELQLFPLTDQQLNKIFEILKDDGHDIQKKQLRT